MNVGFHGALGRMNQENIEYIKDKYNINALYDSYYNEINEFSKYIKLDIHYTGNLDELKKSDLIIDFSHFSQVDNLLEFAKKNNKKLIIGTTKLNEEIISKMKLISKEIPIFYSPNMSFGINSIKFMLPYFSKIFKDFDTELIEYHHKYKKDSPSGTAKMLLETIINLNNNLDTCVYDRTNRDKEKSANEIGVSTVRAGGIKGIHEIIFGSDNELITLKHEAIERKAFSAGVFEAINFLENKKNGFYNFDDLIKERFGNV